jgi:hypothetical protein
MRKIVWLIFCVLAGQLFGQSYFPFPRNYAMWDHLVDGPFKNPWEYQYSLEDSTMIDSIWYRNIYADYPGMFYLREDSLRNVYVRFSEEVYIPYSFFDDYPLDQDLLLYSFGDHEIGDTISFDYASSFAVVQSIDSVFITDSYRRSFLVEISGDGMFSGNESLWIEGIGSDQGLLRLWQYEFEWGIVLCEFYHVTATGLEYSYSPSECSYSLLEEPISPEMEFFPNPFNDILEYRSEREGDLKFSIFNQLGIHICDFENIGSSGNLDLTKIPQGSYILKCVVNGEVHQHHVILKL